MTGDSLFGSTTLTGLGATGSNIYRCTIVNGKVDKDNARSVLISSAVTGATTTAVSSYSVGLQMTANAYIESLDDQQLASLVEMLDEKENMMSNEQEINESKQLIKRL